MGKDCSSPGSSSGGCGELGKRALVCRESVALLGKMLGEACSSSLEVLLCFSSSDAVVLPIKSHALKLLLLILQCARRWVGGAIQDNKREVESLLAQDKKGS